MSVCSTCFNADNVPTCTSDLIFGIIDTDEEAVDVYVKNLATGRIDQYVGDVDLAGVVTVADVRLMPNLSYELWASEGQVNERLVISKGSVDYTCIDFKAFKVGPNVVFESFDLMILE